MDISIWQNDQLYYPLSAPCGPSATGYRLIPGSFFLSDFFFFFPEDHLFCISNSWGENLFSFRILDHFIPLSPFLSCLLVSSNSKAMFDPKSQTLKVSAFHQQRDATSRKAWCLVISWEHELHHSKRLTSSFFLPFFLSFHMTPHGTGRAFASLGQLSCFCPLPTPCAPLAPCWQGSRESWSFLGSVWYCSATTETSLFP